MSEFVDDVDADSADVRTLVECLVDAVVHADEDDLEARLYIDDADPSERASSAPSEGEVVDGEEEETMEGSDDECLIVDAVVPVVRGRGDTKFKRTNEIRCSALIADAFDDDVGVEDYVPDYELHRFPTSEGAGPRWTGSNGPNEDGQGGGGGEMQESSHSVAPPSDGTAIAPSLFALNDLPPTQELPKLTAPGGSRDRSRSPVDDNPQQPPESTERSPEATVPPPPLIAPLPEVAAAEPLPKLAPPGGSRDRSPSPVGNNGDAPPQELPKLTPPGGSTERSPSAAAEGGAETSPPTPSRLPPHMADARRMMDESMREFVRRAFGAAVQGARKSREEACRREERADSALTPPSGAATSPTRGEGEGDGGGREGRRSRGREREGGRRERRSPSVCVVLEVPRSGATTTSRDDDSDIRSTSSTTTKRENKKEEEEGEVVDVAPAIREWDRGKQARSSRSRSPTPEHWRAKRGGGRGGGRGGRGDCRGRRSWDEGGGGGRSGFPPQQEQQEMGGVRGGGRPYSRGSHRGRQPPMGDRGAFNRPYSDYDDPQQQQRGPPPPLMGEAWGGYSNRSRSPQRFDDSTMSNNNYGGNNNNNNNDRRPDPFSSDRPQDSSFASNSNNSFYGRNNNNNSRGGWNNNKNNYGNNNNKRRSDAMDGGAWADKRIRSRSPAPQQQQQQRGPFGSGSRSPPPPARSGMLRVPSSTSDDVTVEGRRMTDGRRREIEEWSRGGEGSARSRSPQPQQQQQNGRAGNRQRSPSPVVPAASALPKLLPPPSRRSLTPSPPPPSREQIRREEEEKRRREREQQQMRAGGGRSGRSRSPRLQPPQQQQYGHAAHRQRSPPPVVLQPRPALLSPVRAPASALPKLTAPPSRRSLTPSPPPPSAEQRRREEEERRRREKEREEQQQRSRVGGRRSPSPARHNQQWARDGGGGSRSRATSPGDRRAPTSSMTRDDDWRGSSPPRSRPLTTNPSFPWQGFTAEKQVIGDVITLGDSPLQEDREQEEEEQRGGSSSLSIPRVFPRRDADVASSSSRSREGEALNDGRTLAFLLPFGVDFDAIIEHFENLRGTVTVTRCPTTKTQGVVVITFGGAIAADIMFERSPYSFDDGPVTLTRPGVVSIAFADGLKARKLRAEVERAFGPIADVWAERGEGRVYFVDEQSALRALASAQLQCSASSQNSVVLFSRVEKRALQEWEMREDAGWPDHRARMQRARAAERNATPERAQFFKDQENESGEVTVVGAPWPVPGQTLRATEDYFRSEFFASSVVPKDNFVIITAPGIMTASLLAPPGHNVDGSLMTVSLLTPIDVTTKKMPAKTQRALCEEFQSRFGPLAGFRCMQKMEESGAARYRVIFMREEDATRAYTALSAQRGTPFLTGNPAHLLDDVVHLKTWKDHKGFC